MFQGYQTASSGFSSRVNFAPYRTSTQIGSTFSRQTASSGYSSWMNSSSSEVSQFNVKPHTTVWPKQTFLETKVHITIEGETEPYLIKIPKHIDNICLSDLKAKMPTKGDYRYYFKTIDSCGAPYNEEIIYDSIKLPSFEGKISVKCQMKS